MAKVTSQAFYLRISHVKYVPEKTSIAKIQIVNEVRDDHCTEAFTQKGVAVDYKLLDTTLQGNRPPKERTTLTFMNEDTFNKIVAVCVLRGYEVFIEPVL